MWNKPTVAETREINYILTYTGIYPDESWTTASKAVMKALRKMNFKAIQCGSKWILRRV